jgi:hypothetical protein
MRPRVVALLVVVALIGPSVAAATCELTCALDSHHHGTPSNAEASCHGQQAPVPGLAVSAVTTTPCHESGDLPSAILDVLKHAAAASLLPSAPVLLALPGPGQSASLVVDHRTPFNPRPAHRPLRV